MSGFVFFFFQFLFIYFLKINCCWSQIQQNTKVLVTKRKDTITWLGLFAILRGMINESYLGRRKKVPPLHLSNSYYSLKLLHSLFECISPLFIRHQCQNSHLTPLYSGLGNVIKTDPSPTTRPCPTNQWQKKYEYNQNWFLGQQKRANSCGTYCTFF